MATGSVFLQPSAKLSIASFTFTLLISAINNVANKINKDINI